MEININKELRNIIENNDWNITCCEIDNNNIITLDLQTYTNYDCNFTVSVLYEVNSNKEIEKENLINALIEFYNNFDVSYETYLWLDGTGHGIDGAPYDMKDVYEDQLYAIEQLDKLTIEISQKWIID